MTGVSVRPLVQEVARDFYTRFFEEHDTGCPEHNGCVAALCRDLDTITSETGSSRAVVWALTADVVRPFFRLGPIIDRAFRKPCGYPGDYLLMHWIHTGCTGEGVSGAWDRTFLAAPSARAVRNRLAFLSALLEEEYRRSAAGSFRILSLGSGPAHELDALLDGLDVRIEVSCIDIDPDALEFVRQRLDGNRRLGRLNTYRCDVRRLGGITEGAFDCVYSAGLFDYLGDDDTVSVLDSIHDLLKPGGLMILGNFVDRRPLEDRFSMDEIMQWKLNYRNSAALQTLGARSRFRGVEQVRAEPTGINLFALLRHD